MSMFTLTSITLAVSMSISACPCSFPCVHVHDHVQVYVLVHFHVSMSMSVSFSSPRLCSCPCQCQCIHVYIHRWALSPISVISDIGLSLISELPISDWESGVRHYIGYRNKVLSDIRYPTSHSTQRVTVAQCYSARWPIPGAWVRICTMNYFFLQCRISEWAQMSISEHFRYRNDVFQSDIFVSDIGITDVDVDVGYRRDWARCRCPPMFISYPCVHV
jgi:hypothetical protein